MKKTESITGASSFSSASRRQLLQQGARTALTVGATGLLGPMLAGCPAAAPPDPSNGPTSGAPSQPGGEGQKLVLQFWHTRRRAQEALLNELCAQYGRENSRVEIQPAYQGTYDDLNQKLRAAIQARAMPDLAMAYETQVAEYMKSGVIRALDDLVIAPEGGLTEQDLADIPAAFLEANRFGQYDGKLLSFPFTKSHLVLYYNRTLLESAGYQAPPTTWEEFEKMAGVLTSRIKNPAWVWTPDPSTIDGLIVSHGGTLTAADGASTTLADPATVKAFALLHRMAKAGQLKEVTYDNIPGLFTGQRCVFVLDTSSGRAATQAAVGNAFKWDIAPLPHAAGVAPATVLYGGNVCIFRSDSRREREAWEFIRYFTSPEVTARWSRETGFLPVRRSALKLPEMVKFLAENLQARHAVDSAQAARGEPNLLGWQEVRKHLEAAARSVVSGTEPVAAAVELKKKADQALAGSR